MSTTVTTDLRPVRFVEDSNPLPEFLPPNKQKLPLNSSQVALFHNGKGRLWAVQLPGCDPRWPKGHPAVATYWLDVLTFFGSKGYQHYRDLPNGVILQKPTGSK